MKIIVRPQMPPTATFSSGDPLPVIRRAKIPLSRNFLSAIGFLAVKISGDGSPGAWYWRWG